MSLEFQVRSWLISQQEKVLREALPTSSYWNLFCNVGKPKLIAFAEHYLRSAKNYAPEEQLLLRQQYLHSADDQITKNQIRTAAEEYCQWFFGEINHDKIPPDAINQLLQVAAKKKHQSARNFHSERFGYIKRKLIPLLSEAFFSADEQKESLPTIIRPVGEYKRRCEALTSFYEQRDNVVKEMVKAAEGLGLEKALQVELYHQAVREVFPERGAYGLFVTKESEVKGDFFKFMNELMLAIATSPALKNNPPQKRAAIVMYGPLEEMEDVETLMKIGKNLDSDELLNSDIQQIYG